MWEEAFFSLLFFKSFPQTWIPFTTFQDFCEKKPFSRYHFLRIFPRHGYHLPLFKIFVRKSLFLVTIFQNFPQAWIPLTIFKIFREKKPFSCYHFLRCSPDMDTVNHFQDFSWEEAFFLLPFFKNFPQAWIMTRAFGGSPHTLRMTRVHCGALMSLVMENNLTERKEAIWAATRC